MSQTAAFGVWLCAGLAVFPQNKCLAYQLFPAGMDVAEVPVHLLGTVFRRQKEQSKAI